VTVGNNLYVTTDAGASSAIKVIDKHTLTLVESWETTITPTGGYAGIDVGPDGRLYVVDQDYQGLDSYTPPVTSFNLAPTLISSHVDFDRILVSSPVATPTLIISDVIGSGSISIVPDKDFYFAGDVVTVQAIPVVGSTFTGWSGTLIGQTISQTITLNETVHFTSTFVPSQYTVSVNVQGNGSVALNPAQATYFHNSEIIASANAAPG
jgi:hypothetical protein